MPSPWIAFSIRGVHSYPLYFLYRTTYQLQPWFVHTRHPTFSCQDFRLERHGLELLLHNQNALASIELRLWSDPHQKVCLHVDDNVYRGQNDRKCRRWRSRGWRHRRRNWRNVFVAQVFDAEDHRSARTQSVDDDSHFLITPAIWLRHQSLKTTGSWFVLF